MMGIIRALFGSKNKAKYTVKDKFTEIHDKNLFHGVESVSGTGSNLIQTAEISKRIPELLEEFSIESIMDAPCGDFFWMRHVQLRDVHYTGVDIVQSLVDKNNSIFLNDKRAFKCMNIIEDDLPSVDLILCRDCLVHLTYAQAFDAIRNFKRSGSKYLLTTTFPGRINKDLGTIIWRPLDLQQAPFNFPVPVKLINEKCTEDGLQFTDKSLGLWDLSEINI